MYQNSWGFIKKAVNHFPEEVRQMFQELYNETIPLTDRIETFQRKAEALVPRVKEATAKKSSMPNRTNVLFQFTWLFVFQRNIFCTKVPSTTACVRS